MAEKMFSTGYKRLFLYINFSSQPTLGNSFTGANTFSVSFTSLPLDGGRLSGAEAGNGKPLQGPWNSSVRIRLISKGKMLLLVVFC